jgi:[ribosomal protein S18]-alanine N-acetyltransferase
VRESNVAAIGLYQRAGLKVDGRRPAYYVDPVEDAVLMSLDLEN